jgi:hypothetical protein
LGPRAAITHTFRRFLPKKSKTTMVVGVFINLFSQWLVGEV